MTHRTANKSEPYNILVSLTVKDLVARSGLVFDDYGLASFEGMEGEWRLFKVVTSVLSAIKFFKKTNKK